MHYEGIFNESYFHYRRRREPPVSLRCGVLSRVFEHFILFHCYAKNKSLKTSTHANTKGFSMKVVTRQKMKGFPMKVFGGFSILFGLFACKTICFSTISVARCIKAVFFNNFGCPVCKTNGFSTFSVARSIKPMVF